MDNIQNIYDMLNCEKPSEIRLEGVRLAERIDNLDLLIQPPAPPSVWECCAQILAEKSDVELEPYLDELLTWLQDLNWPGATVVFNRLKLFPGEKLKKPLIRSITCAANSDAAENKMWLSNLFALVEGDKGTVLLSPEECPIQRPRGQGDGSVGP